MLKRVKVKKLGRTKGARTALLRSLTKNLFEKGAIETSVARAKVLKSFVDHLLKTSDKAAQVQQKRVTRILAVGRQTSKQIAVLGASFKNGESATRIVRLGQRAGDASIRVRIELVKKLGVEKK